VISLVWFYHRLGYEHIANRSMADDPTLTPRPETSMSARPEPRAGVAPIKPE
jgi:hypothetical protein